MNSALYEGWVRHRRYALQPVSPRPHDFRYRIFLLWLDLSELDRVFAGRWLWSVDRPNLASFRRKDYLGDPAIPLDEAVRQEVARQTGQRPEGPIRLLTHPRYFGYGFNPVSLYYCHGADGETLEAIVAEVTNTPWKERHVYVLPMAANLGTPDKPRFKTPKAFHVSPFLPMDLDYVWRLTRPGEHLLMHLDDLQDERKAFDATLNLRRRPLTGANLARALLRFPFMTGQVVFGIYWQALRLWLKGTPLHDHPGMGGGMVHTLPLEGGGQGRGDRHVHEACCLADPHRGLPPSMGKEKDSGAPAVPSARSLL
jgi:hypothetical protein